MNRAPNHDVIVDVVTEVAKREGVEPTDLPPLARTIDPDALATIVSSAEDRTVRVEFTYEGYDVTVETSGTVRVGNAAEELRE